MIRTIACAPRRAQALRSNTPARGAARLGPQVVEPEYRYDFAALGSPELAGGLGRLGLILAWHWGASWAAAAALLLCVWRGPPRPAAWGLAFAAIKLAHFAASLAGFACFPGDGWLVTFPVQILLLHGWMGALQFRQALGMIAAAVALDAAAVPAVRSYSSELKMARRLIITLMYAVGAALLAWITDGRRRRAWRLRRVYELELGRLRAKLLDLLPADVAEAMLRSGGPPPCERRAAAVLQLDVCGFTAMSQELPPRAVAAMMHGLFSRFDQVRAPRPPRPARCALFSRRFRRFSPVSRPDPRQESPEVPARP